MKNILVVEDEALISASLELYLKRGGYNAVIASNGIEAIDALARTDIDLIVTDLNMPVMDGFELIGHLLWSGSAIPVIVMSGNLDSSVERRLHALGVRHCLEKPFDLKELCARVAHELRGLTPNEALAVYFAA